jgi:hypothetical protein
MREQALAHPLVQSRLALGTLTTPLDLLLADARPETHTAIAEALVDSPTREEAGERLSALAATLAPSALAEPLDDRQTEG